MGKTSGSTILILGNGIAGLSAAKAARERDKECRIIMVGEEDSLTYSRPMLTKISFHGFEGSPPLIEKKEWYEENGIEARTGLRVLRLDTKQKKAICDKAELPYDKCVYALGAASFVPPIPGREKKEVIPLRSVADLRKIKRLCVDGGSVVIIGGGVIGLEAAIELRKLRLEVVVLEALPYLMPRLLDIETAEKLTTLLPGIRIKTNVSIKEIRGDDRVTHVELADGTMFPADFIVMSCGVRANSGIAKDAGIEVDRAVVVNDRMETSENDVFACGDCAQFRGINYALWGEAAAQGTVAGANAVGERLRFGAADSSLILNSRDLCLFVGGDLGKDQTKQYETKIEERPTDSVFYVNTRFSTAYKKTFFLEGKPVGVAVLGNLDEMKALRAQLYPGKEIFDESR